MKFGNLRKLGLQFKLISAFFLMAFLVFIVAFIGLSSSLQLTNQLNEISAIRLPSIIGLQMIENGIRDIQAGELVILNSRLSEALREEEMNREKIALESIKAGFSKYEPLPRTPKEDQLWKRFLSKYQRWEEEHQNFLKLYQNFQKKGIISPLKKQLEFYQQKERKSTELEEIIDASILLQQMNIQAFTINHPLSNAVSKSLDKVIQENEMIAEFIKTRADVELQKNQNLVLWGMILGPLVALSLGIVLSVKIAKPLDKTLRNLIENIVSSSTQIAATIQQQQNMISRQAISVNETTTTMDQLSASSCQTVEQAEGVSQGVQVALTLSYAGLKDVEKTLESMKILEEKVTAISQEIMKFKEKTVEINSITNLVTDLANQTNMLALNAAVEAVRAGEQGKGFAVVATEIRKLADQSKNSAEKIQRLVSNIQETIQSTIIATQAGTKTVIDGVQSTKKTADAFTGVSNSITQIAGSSQQISLTAKQQAVAIQQVLEAMNNINQGAQQTAIGIKDTQKGMEQMQKVAKSLKSLGVN